MTDFVIHSIQICTTKGRIAAVGHAGISKSRLRSTDWARTEARDTTPSPRSNGSLNGGGCERVWVTMGCDEQWIVVSG